MCVWSTLLLSNAITKRLHYKIIVVSYNATKFLILDNHMYLFQMNLDENANVPLTYIY